VGVQTVPRERDPVGPTRLRPRDLLAWLVGLSIVTSVHVLVSLDAVAPVQTKDEIGYLAAARWFATGEGAGLLAPEHAGGYAVGWGLVTAPLWWLTGHPPTVYAASVAVNVALSVLVLVPAVAVARRAGLGTPTAVLTATALCVAAGRIGYTGYALPEPLLTLQVTTVLWLLLRLFAAVPADRPTGARVPELAALAVLLAWLPTTHARMLPLAVLGLVAVCSWSWAHRSPAGAGAVALGAGGAAAGWWLNGHVESVLYGDVARVAVAAQQVDGLGVADVLALAAGHAWYAAVAWLGLSLLGWWAAARGAPAELRARTVGPWTWLALGAVLQLGVGAAYLSTRLDVGGRVDQLVYGRYGDPVWFVLALVGAAAVLSAARPARLVAATAGSLLVIAVAGLVAVRLNADRVAGFVQLNVPGVEAWAWRVDDRFVVPWGPATLVATLLLAVVALAAVCSPPGSAYRVGAVATVGVVLLGLGLAAERRNIEPRDAWIRQLFQVRDIVEQHPDADVVLVVDRPLLLSGNAMQWWLADRSTTVVELGEVAPRSTAGTLVVGPADEPPARTRPLVLLGTDPTGTYGVWQVSG
jgi:hypothetical protein